MKKKKNLFKKSLLVYSLIILLLVFAFGIYVYFILVKYENNQTGNFLKSTINSLSDDTLREYLSTNKQDNNLLDSYKKMIRSKDLEFKKGEDDNTFIASLNDRVLFTIKTKVVNEVTKLAIFSYQEREVEEIIPELKRGLVYYDVIVPSNFKIYVDDKVVGEKVKEEEYPNLDYMYYNDSMPKLTTYEVNNLDGEKEIIVKDAFDNKITLTKEKNLYTTDIRSIKVETIEEAKKYLSDLPDISTIAHNWSLYLTRDLTGGYHGFNNIISNYLISGTDIYKMAYNWGHSVDILFTSKHTLGNPPFQNESIKNFEIYGDSAFSCEIYSEKIMIVSRKEQRDIMHDYLYFIKNNGEWKLINIKSIGDKNE